MTAGETPKDMLDSSPPILSERNRKRDEGSNPPPLNDFRSLKMAHEKKFIELDSFQDLSHLHLSRNGKVMPIREIHLTLQYEGIVKRPAFQRFEFRWNEMQALIG